MENVWNVDADTEFLKRLQIKLFPIYLCHVSPLDRSGQLQLTEEEV